MLTSCDILASVMNDTDLKESQEFNFDILGNAINFKGNNNGFYPMIYDNINIMREVATTSPIDNRSDADNCTDDDLDSRTCTLGSSEAAEEDQSRACPLK